MEQDKNMKLEEKVTRRQYFRISLWESYFCFVFRFPTALSGFFSSHVDLVSVEY